MQRPYRGSRSHWRQRTALAVAVAACFAGNFALANPTGPAVAQGQASFATQGNTLTVTNAPGTVINWQGFSIAGNEIARFIQQSQSSSVLNRVVGINPSSILGTLQSNGRVFLVNPNGITIGPGANIDVAGFMASTLNLSDADFLAGRMRFTPASGAGGVVNQGTITTAGGGMVYLVGQDVQNSGIIRSPQGEILLAAGKSVELVDAQTPEVRVQLTAPDNQALNLGQLIATGGRIGMYGTLVRNAGVASANTAVVGENGKIVFKAVNDVTLEAGSVTTASGTQAGAGGGGITIEGERIVNAGAVQVNAADQAAAGNIKMLAQRELVLGNTSRIEAKGANRDSSGGRVFLYSHGDATALGGQVIDISGGLNSGNAGSGEFSAANMVSFGGTLLGSAAPGYARGSFLIDPLNFSFTGGTIAANTTVQAEDNITIDGNATINAGITLTLLADHDDNGGSPAAGVWDTGGGGTGTVGVGSITRSGNFTISGGAGSGLIMYAGGGGIGIGGSGAIQTDLNGGSLSVTINPAAVGAANVAVSQTSTNALSIAGIAAGSNAVALTAGGTIGQTGAISAGLLTTSSAGGTVLNGANLVGAFRASNTGAGNIELTNTIATLDIQGITQNTGDVIIGNTGAITQSVAGITTAADGNINLAASTALTTSQVVTAGGNGAVTLAGSNVVLGANVTGATVNIDATGAITRTGGVVTADTINLGVAGNTTAIGATGAGRIRVASTGGIASPAVDARATTGGVFIEQASGDLATSSYSLNVAGSGQSIELATTNSSIAIDHVAQWNANTADDNVSLLAQGAGSNITAGGSTILTANDATLTATGGTVTLPATSLSGDLSVTAGGTIQQGSAFTVTGTSVFDSGGDVALGGVANSFTGTVTATAAGLVALRTDATPLELGNVSVGTGALTLQLGGDLTQATATAITKTGNGSVSVGANAAGVNVALGNSGNDFGGGAVTLSGLGTFNNVSVRDTNALAALGALPTNIGGNLTLQFDNAAMTVPGVTVGGNLSLTATGIQQGGIFAVTGSSAFNSGAGGVALAGFDNSFGDAVTASASGTGVVALRTDATPLALGNVSTGSAGLGLYLKGNVSQSGGTSITAGGPLYVEANAAGVNVALASATNDFNGGSITLATAGPGTYNNVSVRDTNAAAMIGTLPASIGGDLTLQFDNTGMTVPGVTVGGNLSLTAGGSIQQGGAFTVTGTSAFDAGGDVALAGAANSFTGTVTASAAGLVALQTGATVLELGNVALSGTGGLTLQLGGDVTQAAATAITKTGNGAVGVQANVAGVNVALGNAGNDFGGGAVSLSGPGTFSNVSVRDTNAAAAIGTLPANIGGDLTLHFDNAGITVPGVTVGGNLSLTAGSGIQQGGAFTVTGTSNINSTGGDVALAGFNNGFGGAVTASASGLVALRTDATPLVLGNVSAGGGGVGLYLNGDVSQSGGTAISSGGAVLVEANAAGLNVDLSSATNDFGGGTITLATAGPGAYNNVSVRDTNAAAAIGTLPANIGGDLTLHFDNAGMTVPGVTVGGNLSLTAGGTVSVSGNVSSAGTAELTTTSGNIALGADFGSSGAAATLISAGNITRTAGTVSGTDVILDSASGIGGGTGARVFTAAGNLAARSTGSGGVFLSESDAVTLATLTGVANGVAGTAYDLTAGGTITVSAAVNGAPATGSTTLATTLGNIALGADLGNAAGSTTLVSAGNITRTAGTVSGTDVILDSVSGIGGGTGARVFTAAGNLAARSTGSGSVFLSESGAVTLATLPGVANGAAGGGAYDLVASGTIDVADTVNVSTATGSTTLATSAGNIALAADVGNAGAVTTLVSAGDITRTAGTVIGSGVLLDAATAIGTGGARVSTGAGTLAARTGAGATGGIFITEADNVSIGTVGSVSGVSAGNGGAADVRTTAGDLTLAADVGATGSGNVTLIAGGGATNDLVAGAGRISTGSGLVTLQGDAVGTTAAPILTDLGSGTLAATSGAGDIAISNNTAAGLNSSQLTGFTTGGGVQTINVAQTAGNLSLGGSLNVGADVLVLGAAGDILGNAATTLTASALRLDAGGLIGGANAVNTSTSGTLTLNSGGTAAAGNIAVSEATALPVSRVSLGGSGTGTGRTVSLTSVAGPVTLDAAIGNAADHLTLVAAAGNIAGGAGTATATNLTLNAAGGIGAGSAFQSNTSGNLSLTTAGNAAAGDIALVETNALNTSRVTAIGTTGTGTQAVSITSPSIALGAGIGNAADNLTLIAGTGTISGAATVTAKDLRLDAFNGIGATGTPVFVNTAGNLAAQLTNSAASGAIVISEVAAGAGMTIGTANGISGVTSTNNRAVSLAADSVNIVLNQSVNSGSGQIQLTTTGSGNVSVGATVSGGLVNISAAGTIADSAQITGTTLTTSSAGGTVLDFGHAVTGFNASNVTGGNIQLVNVAPTLTVTGISQNGGGDVLINNTGALTINGAIGNAGTGGAINLTGSTGINLNQNLTATDGNITLNNATTLGANVQLAAGSGDVVLTGATGIGANNLTVSSSNVTTVTGGITGTTGNVDIAATTRTDVDGAIVLSGAGTVQLDRAVLSGVNVTTAGGNITFDGAAKTDTGTLQVGSGGGDVLFNNTLALGAGAGLTVLAGTGSATFSGAVDGPAALTVTASGNTVFGGAVGTGTALASLGTDGGGLTQLNGGAVTTTGGQSYSDTVTLGANATLAGAGITFSNTLNSSVTARTLQINDSATTTFSAAVGNTLGLASLTTNTGGATAINGGSLVTTGAQTYNDAVTLGVNTTLTGVDITFNNTLNSIGAARTLQINDSGTTTFGGLVGNILALASLTTDTGGTTAINAASLDTTGAQTYNDAVTLGANTTLASSGGSDIRFVGALDGPSGLTVNTAGNTIFSAAVGGTTPLASLTTDAAGSTQVNGSAVTTTGAQTYNDGITIAGPATFTATATTATLDFNATLAAATHALTLTADEINFAGGAGSVTGSGLLTLQPNSTAAALNVGSAAGATVGVLDLSATDLAALGNGFSTINLGQTAGTHAITIGNAAFQDPLLVRTPAGGSVSVSGALFSTENIAFNAGGAVQGGGSVTAPRVTFAAGGIGSLAAPLQLNTPDLDVQNSAGNAVMANAGPVSLLNNFSNTATGGELRLITSSGAIDTGVVAVQSAGGRIALIANDTAGGATGNIIVGTGGITSAGGDIALHAADNITINGAIAAGAGNVRMLAGTGPGINAAHASFTGTNPPAPTEPATDDFGFITFNAPVSAANMVLVSSTSTTPTVVSTITQTAAGSIATTGALTAVTLRGAGAPGNGGGTIDLNDATGNNSTGLINLFACSFDGCPNALPTAPFVNQGAPLPPFTTAVYSDGQLFYSDVGGTDVTGIGTSGDFTLYTPGSVSITGPSLSAKNLTIEALVDINVNLLAPFTNNDINGGQPGGSLNFIAGQNVNYTSMVSGATIGTAAVPFNHDLRFQAAGNVTVANAIYVGAGNFVVRANEPASLNNNTVNIPASGTGSVFMQGNHVVSSMGDLTVSGINLTVQGGDTGSANQSAAGQQLLSAGAVNLNLLGDVTVNGGTATGGSDSAAIIRGAVVNVGSAATPVENLSMTGGSSTVTGTTNHEADARIEGTTALNVHVSGDVGLAGGTAIITGTAGSSQKAGASAILKSNSLLFSVAGNVTLTGGTANAATGGNTATANAQIIAGSAFNPVILGDLDLVGGSATAQPIAGEIANAVAGARFESEGDLLLKVSGNISLQGGNAVAINNTGGIFAEADASALVRSGAKVGIEVGQNFDITGGSAVATGSGIRAIGSAGVSTGDIAAGESLLIKTAGNMSMTGGSGSGAAADAAALIYSAAEAKLTVGGPTGLRLEGGTGPFFPPFGTGVFTPNSDLFHMIGGNALVRLEGSAYPITVTGSVTVVNNPALGAALFISEAPPLSLDSLLAAFIKTTDCVSFSGGSCTLSGAVASGSGKGAKDPVGGVCK